MKNASFGKVVFGGVVYGGSDKPLSGSFVNDGLAFLGGGKVGYDPKFNFLG